MKLEFAQLLAIQSIQICVSQMHNLSLLHRQIMQNTNI